MNVFISHSMKDKELIDAVRSIVKRNGITPLIAEEDIGLSGTITEKIERYIAGSELAIVLLTKNGNSANFVQQEIGYLYNAKKPMLVLVEKGLENDVTGFLYGRDFVTVDPDDLNQALKKAEEKLVSFKKVRDHWQAIGAVVLILVGVFIFCAFVSGSK